MICLLSYDLLTNFKRGEISVMATCFFVMLAYVIRLANTVSLMAKIQHSRELLTTQMSILHNTHWLKMDAEVRQVFSAFKFEVNSDQLSASPMGLFTVNHKLMLNLFSLIVTYLMILIQLN